MVYKKKLIILLSVIGVLALTYTASLILDPIRAGSRESLYSWLDSRLAAAAGRIVLRADGEEVELVKKNSRWFVLQDGREYPARQLRVEDFLGIFTERSSWPVRYTNAASHSRLGLEAASASRVIIFGENSTLLDLLIGVYDNIGNEIFLRRFGQNEVRSGAPLAASYIYDSVNKWYNLRLIPDSEGGAISTDSVQRLSVYSPEGLQIFSRRNREWVITGIDVENPDQSSIDAYVRTMLNLEGDDFVNNVSPDDPMFDHSRFVLEMGTGHIITIRFSYLDEETNHRLAHTSGSNNIFLVPVWASQWVYRVPTDFEMR